MFIKKNFLKIKLFADNEYPYKGNEKRNENGNEKKEEEEKSVSIIIPRV